MKMLNAENYFLFAEMRLANWVGKMRQARIVIRTEVWSDVCLIFAERNPVKMLKSTLCHLSCCELCLVILFKDVTRWDWTHMGLVTTQLLKSVDEISL